MQDALSLKRAVLGRFEKQSAAFAAQSLAAPLQPAVAAGTPGPGQYDSCCARLHSPQRAAVAPFVSRVRAPVVSLCLVLACSYPGEMLHR
jgi:hypothetical protein